VKSAVHDSIAIKEHEKRLSHSLIIAEGEGREIDETRINSNC
jgi:hypothetical protein